MKIKNLKSALLLLLLASPAQAQVAQDAIYMGKPTASDGSTWKSTVGLNFTTNSGGGAFCSGVFISDDLIVTAAHCQIKSGGTLAIMLYPKNGSEAKTIWLEGRDFVAHNHPNYRESSSTNEDDVAFVILRSERLPYEEGFEPANIFHSGVKSAADAGRTATVVGLGRNHRGELGSRVTFAQGQIMGYGSTGSVMEINFTNGQGACGGDSGGPVFVQSGKELYLAALSTATYANLPGSSKCGTTLFANVLTAARYNWIMNKSEVVRTKFRADRQAERQREAAREAELERQRKLEEERQAQEEAKKNPAPAPAPAPEVKPLTEKEQLEADRKKLEEERRAFEEERKRFEDERRKRG